MPSDKFFPAPLPVLLQIILNQYNRNKSILGITENLFFRPVISDPFRTNRYERLLETPIGLAAGPHTQLSQNIVAGWLTGARFIELKTIQTLDELEISKPCIDMQDEGYNCEWSQELKVEQSFDQYLNAWILIHVLKDHLRIGSAEEPGFIFNMSVGYDLKGILSDNVQWFLEKMQNATQELAAKIEEIKPIYPRITQLKISQKLSDNVTLSTMHGCPPHEIEAIGTYLLRDKKLHTTIKLNPTLLGKEELQKIMKNSGFETNIPDKAFEHDLKYDDAIKIISSLDEAASIHNLHFGIKLTNTLESENHKDVFPPHEKMMYMSGRALHPVSVAIANKIQQDFNGRLNISFSGGADAFNVTDLIASGLDPVTVCTDLLKPGGYGKLHQYIEELRNDFAQKKAHSIEIFISARAGHPEAGLNQEVLTNLENYAEKVSQQERYKKTNLHDPSIKTTRPLGWFDCIHAPCEDTCPTNQDIPNYNYHTANGEFQKAAAVIRQTNPFPQTTGMICDHLCQLKCTRLNYDHPVLIREIKRFVAERAIMGDPKLPDQVKPVTGKNVAVIGAGPSGLSCAAFLARAGFQVEIFETKSRPGGMVSSGIPSFRLTDEAIKNDVADIESLGVKIHYDEEINQSRFEKLRNEYDYIYIAAGAQRSSKLRIESIEAAGVIDPLHFLEDLKDGKKVSLGTNIVIIGGGNTAMDVARTAFRLVGKNGKVTIVYRRTIKEMPADMGEIKAALAEGTEIIELVAPVRVNTKDGKVTSITCIKMALGQKDASGRPTPVKIPGSEFEIEADTIIPAVGQELAIDFCDPTLLRTKSGSYETQIPRIYIGGDAMRGASTAINAIGDGRKVAQEIIDREKIAFSTKPENLRMPQDINWHAMMRATKMPAVEVRETSLEGRKNFNLVSSTISEEEAMYEASRCLLCDEVCNICTTVCPNLAFHSYEIQPISIQLQKLVRKNGNWEIAEDNQPFEVKQQRQILHIADWCNNCGNCNTFCPSADAPYKVKPHLFLNNEAFESEDEGFWLEHANGKRILHSKSKGKLTKFTREEGRLIYEFGNNRIVLDENKMEVIDYEINSFEEAEIELSKFAEMAIILSGVISFMERE
ncbi:MAG: putative selenate reductase subunit YgfK [Bacteroidales bacterium]|nr:putative selenate reductase subunit YgfK [Bacteroidales bacterium]